MSDAQRNLLGILRELHAEAEGGIVAAERATLAAAELSGGLVPPLEDEFEYRAAVRDLRAALTALRSVLLDLDRDSEQ